MGNTGEGKFHIAPTYKIPTKGDSKGLGYLTYTVNLTYSKLRNPGVTEASAGGCCWECGGDPANYYSDLTITNEAYF